MGVTSIDSDLDELTLSVVADFDAPIDRVWGLWADPRRLERWWGPPTYPATVQEHDLSPGGGVAYYMTSPEGERFHGWWRVEEVDAPRSLRFTDGFADAEGKPNDDMPTMSVRMELTEQDGGTHMVLRSTFASREQMDQLLSMGMQEGLQGSIGQMDALLAD